MRSDPVSRAARTSPDAAALAALALTVPRVLSSAGVADYGALKRSLRSLVARDPMDAALGTVMGATYLFWLAERDANPQVRSFWDALVFISTCMSVGYAQVFAVTPSGKAIASFVMTAGPSLTARFFDAPAAPSAPAGERADGPPEGDAAWRDAVLRRLDALVHAMAAAPARDA